VIVSPENKSFWHHYLFKQIRYWILKPQTHTHHHTKNRVYTGGVSLTFSALSALRPAVPADIYSTVLFGPSQLEVHLHFAGIRPDQSDRRRP
ncbi:hypothetical protein, partial [Brevibacterium marinum]|uniref:hypothetical protein n=1 Tax=Brevibacterium marinum TaxID=418643 RepID=UPI0031D38D70